MIIYPICLNIQPNMPKFWILVSSEYGYVLNVSALNSILNCARICLDRIMNIYWALNLQDSEYGKVLNMQELHGIYKLVEGNTCIEKPNLEVLPLT